MIDLSENSFVLFSWSYPQNSTLHDYLQYFSIFLFTFQNWWVCPRPKCNCQPRDEIQMKLFPLSLFHPGPNGSKATFVIAEFLLICQPLLHMADTGSGLPLVGRVEHSVPSQLTLWWASWRMRNWNTSLSENIALEGLATTTLSVFMAAQHLKKEDQNSNLAVKN